jgi:hypothetical protein
MALGSISGVSISGAAVRRCGNDAYTRTARIIKHSAPSISLLRNMSRLFLNGCGSVKGACMSALCLRHNRSVPEFSVIVKEEACREDEKGGEHPPRTARRNPVLYGARRNIFSLHSTDWCREDEKGGDTLPALSGVAL